jgi:hypothetical protein
MSSEPREIARWETVMGRTGGKSLSSVVGTSVQVSPRPVVNWSATSSVLAGGIDIDAARVSLLPEGRAPFFEPGFPEVLVSALSSGRLRFSTDIADVSGAQVHFVAVGTTQQPGSHAAGLTFVDAAVHSLLPYLGRGTASSQRALFPRGPPRTLER